MHLNLSIKALSLLLLFLFIAGCATRPQPISEQQFAETAALNVALLGVDQEPIRKPINLYEAMARATKYNLEYRIKQMEVSLRNSELNLAHFKFLPDAVVNSGYTKRNNISASSSLNRATGILDTSGSTSQDLRLQTQDLTFGWNVLDFGLSYIRAQQAGDRVLISAELRERSLHKLIEDVRSVYWRAHAYQNLVKHLNKLEKRTARAIITSRAMSQHSRTSRIDALNAERKLLGVKRSIIKLKRDLVGAKVELAGLMNLKPGTPFTIASGSSKRTRPRLNLSSDEMMERAIRDRPELRENIYKQRINMREARAALVELLPGLNLDFAPHWNSNSYLINSNWVSWGARVGWSLLKVFQYPTKKKVITQESVILETRALALTVSIMTQVHLGYIKLVYHRSELDMAKDYLSVQKRILKQAILESGAGRLSDNELLHEEINTLIAKVKYDLAFSDLQNAHAGLITSIGETPYGLVDATATVGEVAAQFQAHNKFQGLANKSLTVKVGSK